MGLPIWGPDPCGGYLVVACSGRDIAAPGPGGYLHANFSLDADGEYVALSNPGGDVVSELGNVASQDSFHTWGLDPTNGGYRFLDRATPGADNAGSSAVDRAEDVEIDRETGYYDGSLTIGLSCPTPGAVIRFTTDGSEPTESNGSIYTGAFDLSSHVDHPPGNILREFWSGVLGANVADFAFDTPPSSSTLINPVEVSFNAGENVATRLRGFVKPAVTAQYTFWVAGNDSAELWLSPTASPADRQRIAFTTQPTFLQGWSVSPTQQAAPVLLQAGGRYYIEVLHKDATGSDHVSVAWKDPVSRGPFSAGRSSRRPPSPGDRVVHRLLSASGRGRWPPTCCLRASRPAPTRSITMHDSERSRPCS